MVTAGRVPADPSTLDEAALHTAVNDALNTTGAPPTLVALV